MIRSFASTVPRRSNKLAWTQRVHTAWLGGLYNYAGRYDGAIAEAKKAKMGLPL